MLTEQFIAQYIAYIQYRATILQEESKKTKDVGLVASLLLFGGAIISIILVVLSPEIGPIVTPIFGIVGVSSLVFYMIYGFFQTRNRKNQMAQYVSDQGLDLELDLFKKMDEKDKMSLMYIINTFLEEEDSDRRVLYSNKGLLIFGEMSEVFD